MCSVSFFKVVGGYVIPILLVVEAYDYLEQNVYY